MQFDSKIVLHLSPEAKVLASNPDDRLARAVQHSVALFSLEGERQVKRTITHIGLVDTGRLRSSITHDVRGAGMLAQGIVGTNVIYARIHEYGGIILPKKGKYLRFEVPVTTAGPRGGKRKGKQVVFARKVTIKPKRYFARSRDLILMNERFLRRVTNDIKKIMLGGAPGGN